MDQLQTFDVNPGLSKSEFVNILKLHNVDDLKSLRASLFMEACIQKLVSPELEGLPLVNRRGTALRPATTILGEDIWHIMNSISNNVMIPRILFKNGKKNKSFLENAPRSSQVSISSQQPSVLNITLSSSENENRISSSQESHQLTPLPSSAEFSNMLLTREINRLKDELRSVKNDVAVLKRLPTMSVPIEVKCQFSKELMEIKQEVSSLRCHITQHTSLFSPPPPEVSEVDSHMNENRNCCSIKLTTFNCRGIQNSVPYLHHLIEDGADIIAVTEHWLWPYQLLLLKDIHPSYEGFGYSDSRLDEHSNLFQGCGGVGIIWKKSLRISPITSITSDRFCAARLFLSEDDSITILCAYLPSSDHSFEEFKDCVNELSSVAGALELYGPIALMGDFNTHLSTNDSRSELLSQVIQECNLYPVSTSCIAQGPNYTFFSGERRTMIDYIFLDASLGHSVVECCIHNHHSLNMSDHLPLSITLRLSALTEQIRNPKLKINWPMSAEKGLTYEYAVEVSKAVSPLLTLESQSIAELNLEVLFVSKALQEAASKYLPVQSHHKKKKSYIKDKELRRLCKESREAWMKWQNAGRPSEGMLCQNKRKSKKLVRQYVASCRAKAERRKIQSRDWMFKENHNHRFKYSKNRSECKSLLINDQIKTDPNEIANHFKLFYGNLCSSSSSSHLDAIKSTIPDLVAKSYWNDDGILDTPIDVSEIEGALKTLKLGRSGGADGLDPEHVFFGGEVLKLWLKKIFNRLIVLEEIPNCLNEGLVIPIYKRNGKDPLLVNSYRGITLSSVIIKVFEIILLQRLTPLLEETGFPDLSQTAYRKGMSCSDAIYATQETLLSHARENGKPFLCFYDVEKAFDSVELPILLKEMYAVGINGKMWRLVKSWYSSSSGRVRIDNHISDKFIITRGVKQGSVLSPTLFLIVMDVLLKRMKESKCGLSVRGTYTGAAIHADDLRTTASSIESTVSQANIIKNFTDDSCLKLNNSKLEVIRISTQPFESESLQINDISVSTSSSAKCLGVWWQHNLSAKRSISENINKARKAFFALGSLGAFQGDLNPLSSSSIFETCIIPTLLYGCETWILDAGCLKALESFQCEIGRRILHLPKLYSNNSVRIGLHWPTMSTRILLRKLAFLAKLLSPTNDSLSGRVFTSLAIDDVYESSVVQQCRMLESCLGTDILASCLSDPDSAVNIVKSNKSLLLKQDFDNLVSTSITDEGSCSLIARVAKRTSWRRLWDMALDKGVKGTKTLQKLFKELARSKSCFNCIQCEPEVMFESSCFEHICAQHSDCIGELSCNFFLDTLTEANSESVFSMCSRLSNCTSLWSVAF